jgi:protein-S-isoprenylcysteine O-methyltransferase Ste14
MSAWRSWLILLLWALWFALWRLAARGEKAVAARESAASRASYIAPILLGLLLLVYPWPGWLSIPLIGGGSIRYWVAVALLVAGLALTVWARSQLSANWSGTVTLKVDHELVCTGPFRHLRHPTYSGALLAIFGTALATGQLRGLLAVLLTAAALWHKLSIEERWLMRRFGQRYADYRRTSRALIPFVL